MIPDLLTRAERLAQLEFPPLQRVTTSSLSRGDCLVLCAGFEDRTRALLDAALDADEGFRVLLIEYEPVLGENMGGDIRRACAARGVGLQQLTYDREAPSGFGDNVVEALDSISGRIVIDVSAMSRLLIVQLLVALNLGRTGGLRNCFVGYTEAAHYPPTPEAAELELERAEDPSVALLFLSAGVLDITVVPELASVAPPDSQSRLVAFPSLDSHQLTALRSELQPSRLTVIEGVPPDERNRWRKDLVARVNRLHEITGLERLSASTLEYSECLRVLVAVYQTHSRYERILIAPTGSKMQAVAVGVLRSLLRDVQIVYPTPLTFLQPQHYTEGVGARYLLQLSPFAELIAPAPVQRDISVA